MYSMNVFTYESSCKDIDLGSKQSITHTGNYVSLNYRPLWLMYWL